MATDATIDDAGWADLIWSDKELDVILGAIVSTSLHSYRYAMVRWRLQKAIYSMYMSGPCQRI